ncbi:MAG: protein translocase subunit SecD [Bdellovibrionales bacterium CG10_big_fil_rev_8_21_14_0_10_45_34]|nr:MAG: protein translocase subunit SecD [Bdellovibrionales bacterium CG10_big_fil_rev_8_21_14_0_10_45_34]
MDRVWKLKLIGVILVFTIVGMYLYPTFSNLDVQNTSFPIKKKVNLGLDLQGGMYMVFSVDIQRVFKESLEKRAATIAERLEKEKSLKVTTSYVGDAMTLSDDPHVYFSGDAGALGALKEMLATDYTEILVIQEEPARLETSFSWIHRQSLQERTLDQSIQVIRNRIDEFGVTEPSIVTQGTDRIVIELPGVSDLDRAKSLIGRTAKLEFKLVDEEAMTKTNLGEILQAAETDAQIKFEAGKSFLDYVERVNQFAKGKIPEDSVIAFERNSGDQVQNVATGIPYILKMRTEISGDLLRDAYVTFDQYGASQVAFKLEPTGAADFAALTEKNIGRRMAIVLDGIVHSAPNIESKIPGGEGVITLGRGNVDQNQTLKEANDLSIVLRAGALPARLDLSEQRVIGPTLGADSISKGVTAGLIGCALIVIFMIFYYRVSGVIAVISLVLNASMMIAILIGIGATLTLPGIAGIALGIGIAVDSNVIIFERIRDEIHEGASIVGAVERGFDRALTCIIDSHLTQAIIAIILLSFGTGPIKGYAVTLLISIATTLFCAVIVAKLIFDAYIGLQKGTKKMSI